jgi:hypothetical protein
MFNGNLTVKRSSLKLQNGGCEIFARLSLTDLAFRIYPDWYRNCWEDVILGQRELVGLSMEILSPSDSHFH